MTLTQELRAFLGRAQLPQSDRGLIKRVIEELRELEDAEARSDAHEKAAFENTFPRYRKKRQ